MNTRNKETGMNKEKKVLFRAQLNQINMDLKFKYDMQPPSSLEIPDNKIKCGNITLQFFQRSENNSQNQQNSSQQFRIYQQPEEKLKEKNALQRQSKTQKQSDLSQYDKRADNKQKQIICHSLKRDIRIQKVKKNKAAKQAQQFGNIRNQQSNLQVYQDFHKFSQIKSQQQQMNQMKKEKQNNRINQKKKTNIQIKTKKEEKSEKNSMKLDLSFLDEESQEIGDKDEHQQGNNKKIKVERNRRIGMYIKRLLKNTKAQSIDIKDLVIGVLRNYKSQLKYIQNDQKKIKTLQCLKRRIYECLSVLSAVGLLEKQKKNVSPTEKISVQICENRKQIENLKTQITQKQLRVKFLKQKLFDAITRKRVFQCLNQRNKQQGDKIINKIYLPLKIIIGYKPEMVLKTKKQNNKFINKVEIISKKYIKPIHSIETFMILRRLLPFDLSHQDLTAQYKESIEKEDELDKINKCRQNLIHKMKIRHENIKPKKRYNKEKTSKQKYGSFNTEKKQKSVCKQYYKWVD